MEKSVKRRVGEKLLMPILAAGTSAATGYLAKRAPGFVEEKVWPRLRELAQGGVTEKFPDQLTERVRDVSGIGGRDGETAASSELSREELSQRSDERARSRAKRREATKTK